MSYTGYYSKLYPIVDGKIKYKKSVCILDLNGLTKFLEGKMYVDVDDSVIFDEYTDRKVYPHINYKTLIGFKTWKIDRKNDSLYPDNSDDLRLGQMFNIDRFGVGYDDKDNVSGFFGGISQYTDSFVVFHPNEDNMLPKIWEYLIVEDVDNFIWKIEASNGNATIKKVMINFKVEEDD